VALRLRRLLPTLHCWCFSPPGGLASAELGAAAAGWCTTVVCGHEWAPRLSLPNIDRLRDEMMHAAARCRQPKASVAAGWVWGKRWAEEELFHSPDQIPEETMEVLRRYYVGVDGDARRREMMALAGRFSLPGRVAYMRQMEPPVGLGAAAAGGGCCAGEPERSYAAEWVAPEEVLDTGLVLSARMNADHMPNYHLEVIRRVAAEALAGEAAAGGGAAAPAAAE
jgi:sn1-specific diacylglycerol lipase